MKKEFIFQLRMEGQLLTQTRRISLHALDNWNVSGKQANHEANVRLFEKTQTHSMCIWPTSCSVQLLMVLVYVYLAALLAVHLNTCQVPLSTTPFARFARRQFTGRRRLRLESII